MVSQPIITASKDITDLNERLLNLLSRDDTGFEVAGSERVHLLNENLTSMIASRGFNLFVFDFGQIDREWSAEDLELRFHYLLVARDLAVQKDVAWVSNLLGMSADMSTELVSATKRMIADLARCSTPWRFRYPESIFQGITPQHDPQFLSARMVLSGC